MANGPFKLKYKNSAFPFKSPVKKAKQYSALEQVSAEEKLAVESKGADQELIKAMEGTGKQTGGFFEAALPGIIKGVTEFAKGKFGKEDDKTSGATTKMVQKRNPKTGKIETVPASERFD